MKATEILMEEHRVIERVLAALERHSRKIEQGGEVSHFFFIESADFVKGFADGCHHKKEEGALFPAMVRAGVPKEGGPVGQMLVEHEEGRRFTRAMRSAAEAFGNGEASAKSDIVSNALGYVALLRQHIMKEDKVLFPMADKAIPAAEQRTLAEEFERIEIEETGQGLHEKYEKLADKLEADAV